jgi:hypothetical protein
MSPRNEFFPHKDFDSFVSVANYAEEFYLYVPASKTN